MAPAQPEVPPHDRRHKAKLRIVAVKLAAVLSEEENVRASYDLAGFSSVVWAAPHRRKLDHR